MYGGGGVIGLFSPPALVVDGVYGGGGVSKASSCIGNVGGICGSGRVNGIFSVSIPLVVGAAARGRVF